MHLALYALVVASIVERRLTDGSRAYLVRFRMPDGRQRSKQFKRKRDADAYVSLVEVDQLRGALLDPRLGRTTVAAWYAQWWPTVTNLRLSTRATDDQYFRKHVLPRFGEVALARLDRTALRSWVAELGDVDGADLAPATVHRIVQVFNKCLVAAVEDRLIAYNPLARLPLPRLERQEMRFLDHHQLALLADCIDERYRAFVLLGGYGGLRLGEMLGLRWRHVDFLRRRNEDAWKTWISRLADILSNVEPTAKNESGKSNSAMPQHAFVSLIWELQKCLPPEWHHAQSEVALAGVVSEALSLRDKSQG